MIYTYINIPEIEGDSTDGIYGKKWLPVKSFELNGAEGAAIESKEDSIKSKEDLSQTDDDDAGDYDLMSSALSDGEKWPSSKGKLLDVRKQAGSYAGAHITVTKAVDRATPKIHTRCIKDIIKKDQHEQPIGMVSVYINRDMDGDGIPDLYMAFLLQNCRVTSVSVAGSDNNAMTETLVISYQQIAFYTNFPTLKGGQRQDKWKLKHWDMVIGEPAEHAKFPATPPAPARI